MDAANNVYSIGRTIPSDANIQEEQGKDRRHWWLRVTDWVGITMATLNDKNPNGWSLNPATVTLALVIAGLIAGGSYYMGRQDANNQHLLEKLVEIEKRAATAEKLAIAAASESGPGHSTTPTPEVKKK